MQLISQLKAIGLQEVAILILTELTKSHNHGEWWFYNTYLPTYRQEPLLEILTFTYEALKPILIWLVLRLDFLPAADVLAPLSSLLLRV